MHSDKRINTIEHGLIGVCCIKEMMYLSSKSSSSHIRQYFSSSSFIHPFFSVSCLGGSSNNNMFHHFIILFNRAPHRRHMVYWLIQASQNPSICQMDTSACTLHYLGWMHHDFCGELNLSQFISIYCLQWPQKHQVSDKSDLSLSCFCTIRYGKVYISFSSRSCCINHIDLKQIGNVLFL